ncbi:Acetyltransferase (isoleucine patch superfamily) [Nitrosococcus oceani ATCC 19707]|uniref:Acetyltransferase (Isoleucine patch superfamily) n=2 Tax=Nitrosococcus oceani TaxID=1229 RepID=Q3J957_NITOC|nr:acyltransferase [Nitrosococcus oceani]ABA58639.1 Acetyltransferase (isoleucine patch superfamily) [Nitrosococcus oceani ATCC 19707]EDZ67700.1 Bacterial transferase hexapeptide repeat protein [Nitrosococcus oceani AFC27]KFI18939.1 acetyltransferase [Nitrosococcus oceani C-27]GEM19759.1 acetyltransferase [Nitrosococcus oceani]
MSELQGFPPFAEHYSGVDKLGKNCRISPTVSVMRIGRPCPERGILLGDEVVLFDYVRLVLGDLGLSPETTLIMGNRVIINVGSYLSGEGGLIIEDEVLVGPHVRILSAGHQIHGGDSSIARNPITHKPIHIGKGAWIGAGSTLLQGVTIGEGGVVGAGSVVTKNVPPHAVAVGNPARIKRYRRGYGASKGWRFFRRRR